MSAISERLEAERRRAEERLADEQYSECSDPQNIAFWKAEIERIDEALAEVAFEEYAS